MLPINILSGRRVLIIEDEVLVALDLECVLKNAGCAIVGIASSLQGSYEMLKKGGIDFAVLDINLDGESVFPLAERLRAQGILFLFLTGYVGAKLLPVAFRDFVCLEKPLQGTDLVRAAFELFSTVSVSA